MEAEIRSGCSGVDWREVSETLRRVGMACHDPAVHRKAFEASHTAVFAYHQGRLIGFGRAISDGAYQAAVYDVAVVPEFQGRGVGRALLSEILARVASCNVILYTSPGREGFYERFGLRRMKTGMALFRNPEAMAVKGFTD